MDMTLHEHLLFRKLDMNLHHVWLDEQEHVATFPLWSLHGNLVGYQQYRPNADKKQKNDPKDGKYFTYMTKGRMGVWGLESWTLTYPLFVLEGIFSATRLTYRGCSAIALLQNDPRPELRKWLWCVSKQRPMVFVCDNDRGGMYLRKAANRIGQPHEIVPDGDLGDAPDDYLKYLMEKYDA